MNEDRSGKRTYRRSPGREYGYDYDPLHSNPLSGNGQSGRSSVSPQSEPLTGKMKNAGTSNSTRSSGVLSPRPDPRRTRQLLRQNILATKARNGAAEDTGHIDPDIRLNRYSPVEEQFLEEDLEDQPVRSAPVRRQTGRNGSMHYTSRPLEVGQAPQSRRYIEPVEHLEPSAMPYEDELEYLDPDAGYDEEIDPLAGRVGYPIAQREPEIILAGRRGSRSMPLAEPDIEEEEEEEDQRGRKKKKKKGLLSRRKLIVGAVLVGGGAAAAYEFGPKIPGLLESAGSNIEHQLQDAFNRGVAAGGAAVRKELINGLDTLEGVSLEGAVAAANLTRTAYDVFVSPIVTLASTIAGDFLSALLNALIKARGWLQQINADNATLVALTNILQSWVNQVDTMPKKLQTITDTDLDGAQAYLRNLQRTIQQQQAILNGQVTPTPTTSHTPSTTTSPTAQPGTTATPPG